MLEFRPPCYFGSKNKGGRNSRKPDFQKIPPAAGLKTFIFRRCRTCLNALKFAFCMLARRRRKIFTYTLNMLEKPCFSCICALKILKIFRPAAGEIRGDPYLVSVLDFRSPLLFWTPKQGGGRNSKGGRNSNISTDCNFERYNALFSTTGHRIPVEL